MALATEDHFNIVITSKNPRRICSSRSSGVALRQRSFGSIVILEKGFEPVVYWAGNNAFNDSLKYFKDHLKHRYHHLS